MGNDGKIKRSEPEGPERMIAYDEGWFIIAGWFNFLSKFSRSNYKVYRVFAEAFDGQNAQMGNLRLNVTEEFILRATELPGTKEIRFKN